MEEQNEKSNLMPENQKKGTLGTVFKKGLAGALTVGILGVTAGVLSGCPTPTEPIQKPVTYTVTFVVDGKTVKTQTVEEGGSITLPSDPTKEGYDFDGGDWDGDYTNVTGNITITAKWKEKTKEQGDEYYTVTFLDGQNGNVIGTPQAVNKGGNATPPAGPTKEGYDFDGWNGNYSNVQQNETVYAQWKEIEQGQDKFTVTFLDGQGGNTIGTPQTVNKGGNATPPAGPTKEGYDFDGWDGDYTNVTGNITITAKWKEKTKEQGQDTYYTVTFVSNGVTVSTKEVKSGSGVPLPEKPTHPEDRYIFDGWEGNVYNVTEDRTITAKWRAKYFYIEFLDGFGNSIVKRTVGVGGDDYGVPDPTKEGYTFEGWDGSWTNVTEDRVITATWKKIEQAQEQFTVTFLDGQGGNTIGTPQTVNKGGNATPPSNPTKDGYTFDGWNGNYSNVQQNETVYAKWKEIVKEPSTIPAFNFDATTTNVTFPMDGISTGNVNKTGADSNIDDAIIKLYSQSKNLSAGYNAVADEYDASNPIFGELADKEDAYRVKMESVVNPVDYVDTITGSSIGGILDTIFGNSGAERSAFDTEFNAYKLGSYYTQTNRDNTMPAASAAFENALSGISGLPSIQKNQFEIISNAPAILSVLKSKLLTKMDTAMGVDNITNSTNKSRVTELNGYLLNQIGEDISQFDAMLDDYQDIGIEPSNFYWNGISQADEQKSEFLAADFNPQMLKQQQEQTNKRVGALLAKFNPEFIKGQSEKSV
jgi:uncharacterized repeat protein (TIGR02543 family)